MELVRSNTGLVFQLAGKNKTLVSPGLIYLFVVEFDPPLLLVVMLSQNYFPVGRDYYGVWLNVREIVI